MKIIKHKLGNRMNGITVHPIADVNVGSKHCRLKEFKELINCASVFGVDPTADGELLIDININDVWRRA